MTTHHRATITVKVSVHEKLFEVSWVSAEGERISTCSPSASRVGYLSADNGVIRDDGIRKAIECVLDCVTICIRFEWDCLVIFSERIVELESVRPTEDACIVTINFKLVSYPLHASRGIVIDIKWIDSILAVFGGTICTGVSRVARAAHGKFGIPQVVHVIEVVGRKSRNVFARAMARAIIRTRCTLA
jgi:hypothetical protein